jgi:hypothetical protein
LPRKVSVDPAGNKRVLQVVGVGPKEPSARAEHFFEVRLTDLAGNVPEGIRDPLDGPLPYEEAMAAAKRRAAEFDLRAVEED